MAFYRRRLPHIDERDSPVFLTWRLHDSLPPNRAFPTDATSHRTAFEALDRLLDEVDAGMKYLRQAAIAEMVIESVHHAAETLHYYDLHSFVVMPNHVHLLITLHVRLARITQSIKSFTARRANEILGRIGQPFWQEESYDHLVRDNVEFEQTRLYIESNPVRAGLVAEPELFPWSSAATTVTSE